MSELKVAASSSRGLTNQVTEWHVKTPEGKIAVPWACENGMTAEEEAQIKSHMDQMTKDLGCFEMIHVSRADRSSSSYPNGILFVPGSKTGGGCWSSLGLAPGSTGKASGPITQWDAVSTWQVISIDPASCIGATESTVQHEGTDLNLHFLFEAKLFG